jgi:hypothetical protein
VSDVRFVSVVADRADATTSADSKEEEKEEEGGWRDGFCDARRHACGIWHPDACVKILGTGLEKAFCGPATILVGTTI